MRGMKRYFCAALCLAITAPHAEAVPARTRIGWVEKVGVYDADIVLKARIDTGAGMSSVNADIIRILPSEEKDAPDRVVYRIHDEGTKTKTMRSDIVEWQNIKKKDSKDFIRRPVVRMSLCIGKKKITGRVNLADRSHFLYPVLIGRNFLRTGDYMVDSRKTFTREPRCSRKQPA